MAGSTDDGGDLGQGFGYGHGHLGGAIRFDGGDLLLWAIAYA
ncbi:hypothetical protein [Streptomyces sp. NRRL S-1813]|nr:hypothetical protein [Streptomyces sp. NRRL S-1813]